MATTKSPEYASAASRTTTHSGSRRKLSGARYSTPRTVSMRVRPVQNFARSLFFQLGQNVSGVPSTGSGRDGCRPGARKHRAPSRPGASFLDRRSTAAHPPPPAAGWPQCGSRGRPDTPGPARRSAPQAPRRPRRSPCRAPCPSPPSQRIQSLSTSREGWSCPGGSLGRRRPDARGATPKAPPGIRAPSGRTRSSRGPRLATPSPPRPRGGSAPGRSPHPVPLGGRRPRRRVSRP